MDAKLVFWTLALLNMAAVVAFAFRGVRAIRRDEVAVHKRSMLTCGGLIVLFLASYVVKVAALGGEDLGRWSDAHRYNLWTHETFVVAMLLAGGTAWLFARRFEGSRRVTGDPSDPVADPARLGRHRMAGKIAVGASVMGFLTACGILAGMISRAG
jgi:uncharacterized membrane protein YozB (DUF420 family)